MSQNEKDEPKKLLTLEIPKYKKEPDEGDALKGKYTNEDLQNRKQQWGIVPMAWDDSKEQDIDFMLRQLSIASNGMGALGEDFPLGVIASCPVQHRMSHFVTSQLRRSDEKAAR